MIGRVGWHTGQMDYGFFLDVTGPFDDVVQRVTDQLKAEGFGVLTDIDFQKAMREKLGEEMPAYRVLGACNPPLAFQALQGEPEIGLLLPCNVTVRDLGDGAVRVGFLNPDTMVQLTGNPAVRTVAEDASARLHRVRDALAAG